LGVADGMPAPCVLTADNMTLITATYLTRRITTLDAERMAAVCKAISVATGC
jgi:mRNA-degrading endonuclease toxin of MazEF toxin-antitoxin module